VLAPYRSYKVSKRGRERGCRYDTGLKEMRRKKMRRKKMYWSIHTWPLSKCWHWLRWSESRAACVSWLELRVALLSIPPRAGTGHTVYIGWPNPEMDDRIYQGRDAVWPSCPPLLVLAQVIPFTMGYLTLKWMTCAFTRVGMLCGPLVHLFFCWHRLYRLHWMT